MPATCFPPASYTWARSVLHLDVQQFAVGNIALTLVWLGVALLILRPQYTLPRIALRPLAPAAAAIALLLIASPALAQETREEQLAAQRADKSLHLQPYRPDALEARLRKVESTLSMFGREGLYPFVGSAVKGGGVAFGPGYRRRYSDTGIFDAHGAWSVRNFKAADASLMLPALADGRVRVTLGASRVDAPRLAFYGTGNASNGDRQDFSYAATTVGFSTTLQATRLFAVGGGFDSVRMETKLAGVALDPAYRRSRSLPRSTRGTSPGYTRRGGLYRIDWSDYRQANGGGEFRRTDAEVQQFLPILRENWVIALRALASTTQTSAGHDVPYFLMPDLGGSEMLRGYPSWRFRDRNRLLSPESTAGPPDPSWTWRCSSTPDRSLHEQRTSTGRGFTKTLRHRTHAAHVDDRRDAHRSRADASEETASCFSVSPSF